MLNFLPGGLQERNKLVHYRIRISTGGEIRTPINGFGDRYSTLELHPYIDEPCCCLKKFRYGLLPKRTAKVRNNLKKTSASP